MFFDLWSFLHAWESRWQPLNDFQRSRFLSEAKLLAILIHPRLEVQDSLNRFRSFEEIVADLQTKSRSAEFNDGFEITASDVGMAEPDPPWFTSWEDLGLEAPHDEW
jgi:hypothetical protein